MIEYGLVVFGVLTGNVTMAIAWILLKAYSFIPVEHETLSVVGLILLSTVRSLIKAGGKGK